jgi:hypothetical protein
MTPETTWTLAGIAAVLITAIVNLATSRRNKARLDEIHVMVNSNLAAAVTATSNAAQALKEATATIAELRGRIGQMQGEEKARDQAEIAHNKEINRAGE